MKNSTTRRSARRLLAAGLLALTPGLLFASGATAASNGDDPLAQTIDPNQAQGTGQVVLDAGHVDIGPTLSTGQWTLQIHDDTSQPRYWRNLDDVVLRVSDQSILEVPDNESFSFLGLTPGDPVWVIPQVEKSGVIWAGWNTQEPQVLANVNGGVTLRMLGVEGPGDLTVYLQGGNFNEPTPLWTTQQPFPQDIWIELNTHTHANWVFNEPGIYLVDLEVSAALGDGQQVSTTGTLRLAVGDDTDPAAAFTAVSQTAGGAAGEGTGSGNAGAEQTDLAANPAPGQPAEQANPLAGPIMWIVGGVVALALIISFTLLTLSNRKNNRAALARGLAQSGEGAGESAGESAGDVGRGSSSDAAGDVSQGNGGGHS